MPQSSFHPAVAEWFTESFAAPTDCQRQAWESIQDGHDTLIAAPTGSGKTLAAFLAAIDALVKLGISQGLKDETRILYISPLKALSNDIHKNLQAPLDGVNRKLFEHGHSSLAIRSLVRTGDTPAPVRAAMVRQPPHILVTTPESVYILLTSASGRRMLSSVRTVIVDEIHAVVGTKRGAHLALSLERLERLTGSGLIRVGLSATQNPIEQVAQFLTGMEPAGERPRSCRIVDAGHLRQLDLAIELPDTPLEAVLSGEAAASIYERMTALIQAHRTTLIFVNTRRLAERLARALSERVGEDLVTSHHGSLAKEQRLSAETRLKEGRLKALVATASLELGIDVGDVDLVCQFGTTGSIATFLQRVGRAGHYAGGTPKGRLFPTSRDELVECLALLDAVRRRELDRICIPPFPLDVLAQQIVAMVSAEDWDEDELFTAVRHAYPYRELERTRFDAVVRMLAEGFDTRRGPRGAYLHRDGVHKRLRARRGARLTAVTCGGAIPDNAEYRVIVDPAGEFIGTVDEDFAIESMAGDVFQLGNTSWRVLRLEGGNLRVEDAHGQPPSIPFWFGEAPGRTHELSAAVSRLRVEIGERAVGDGIPATTAWLVQSLAVSEAAAAQAVAYLGAARITLGAMPSFDTLVFERFFDESGGMQLIVHCPYGSRLNRAFGLALRKRFCRSFNFELQAAATENAVILSLSTSHSFPLDAVARYLNSNSVRDLLIQALLAAPMFNVRWRWSAVCALALKRFQGGRKTPPYLLRMQAEDLVAGVFPDQLACLENIVGDREIPDHPLVYQSIEDCLMEAMDVERLIALLRGVESGAVRVVACDLVEPSPLAAEIVNARVYSFLDGAPLEERRTRAVSSRRWLDPSTASDLGRLDADAIARVREEARPQAANADELHDALLTTGFLRASQAPSHWPALFADLAAQGRAAELPLQTGAIWFAAERFPWFRALYSSDPALPKLDLPAEIAACEIEPEAALIALLRARLGATGPVRAERLAADLGLPQPVIDQALVGLETEGFALRGRFTPGSEAEEWCERRLLARIHRYTLNRLRKEIEPVAAADFLRFLFRWQRLTPETRGDGPDALAAIIGQLEGFEAAAAAWEGELLPSRMKSYDPIWLDQLCQSGKWLWTRINPALSAAAPVKSSPIALLSRRQANLWRSFAVAAADAPPLSAAAAAVMETLSELGACFYEELVESGTLLSSQIEAGLAELAARGLVHSDSFKGLRALLVPEEKKRRYRGVHPFALEEAGRWTRLPPRPTPDAVGRAVAVEHAAGVLLRRYGVVFRGLLARESCLPSWQELLAVYRRLEARGDIRGGRFVAGQYGEQFALPEAVDALRAARREATAAETIVVNGADPLNLVGIITPGPKLPALAGNRLLYRDGVPTAMLIGKDVRLLQPVADSDVWELRKQLIQRSVPPALKAYL